MNPATMNTFDAGAALCAPFLANLPVAGLSISVVSASGAQSTVGSSDLIATRLEELQFELGEGPTSDVLRSGQPLLTPNLDAEDARPSWPVFAVAARDTGVRALFTFPLLMGMITIGVVSMHSLAVRPPWSDRVVRAAVGLARSTAGPAVALATRSASEEVGQGGHGQPEMRREVHQASGMLMVQLDCSITEAMSRLRAHAFAQGRPIDAVAREIVAGALNLAASDE